MPYACGYAERLHPDLSQLSDRSRRACLGCAAKAGAVAAAARLRRRGAPVAPAPSLALPEI